MAGSRVLSGGSLWTKCWRRGSASSMQPSSRLWSGGTSKVWQSSARACVCVCGYIVAPLWPAVSLLLIVLFRFVQASIAESFCMPIVFVWFDRMPCEEFQNNNKSFRCVESIEQRHNILVGRSLELWLVTNSDDLLQSTICFSPAISALFCFGPVSAAATTSPAFNSAQP